MIFRFIVPTRRIGGMSSERFLRLLHNLVPARLKYFDNIIDSWRDKTVLDLGCGGGFMSEALANKGAKVIGVDPSEAAIAVAQDHAKGQGLAINYKVATGENIPLPDQSVDCVVCVDVLEHVAQLDRVLDEVHRVLRPGGMFLFDTINRTRSRHSLSFTSAKRSFGCCREGRTTQRNLYALRSLEKSWPAEGSL